MATACMGRFLAPATCPLNQIKVVTSFLFIVIVMYCCCCPQIDGRNSAAAVATVQPRGAQLFDAAARGAVARFGHVPPRVAVRL